MNTELGLSTSGGGCQREEKKREVERPVQRHIGRNVELKGVWEPHMPSEAGKEEVDKLSRLGLKEPSMPP